MRIVLFGIMIFFLLNSLLLADLYEVSKTEVDFPGLGKFTSEQDGYYRIMQMKEVSNSDMKGQGIFGKIMASFFSEGKNGKIIDLKSELITTLDYKSKKYSEIPLREFFSHDVEEDAAPDKQEEQSEKAPVRIVRHELKVTDMKISRNINDFMTEEYNIIYIVETENTETKEHQTDSLFITLFTTAENQTISEANRIRNEYYQNLFKASSMEIDFQETQKIMGTEWVNILRSMNSGNQPAVHEPDYSQLQKIKGYPILITGSYFMKKPPENIEEEPVEKPKFGLTGLKKGLVKSIGKSLEKEKQLEAGGYEKVIDYRIETVKIEITDLQDNIFTVPDGFTRGKEYKFK
ncbi:MAG: hypothetical protein JXB60_08440 [Candidatus Cloacimonetes bacterium]|nr:hypothetical protein [Candidatus Cloacimonadota bacterium]